MNESQQLAPIPEGIELNKDEIAAYNSWRSKDQPAIAPSTQAGMLALFLQGTSCQEIQKLNSGFHLGAIVAARIYGKWDQQREQHLQEIFGTVRQRIQQVVTESVHVILDALAAGNKLHDTQLKRFIQTGNKDDLGDLAPTSLRGYKELVELLMKLTGQDKKGNEVSVHHSVEISKKTDNLDLINKPLESEVASKLLELLVKN